jgi:CheY-like chemotaxis protein
LKPGVVDLNGIVRGMNNLMQSALGGTIRIETILQDRLKPALVDPTQLELVVLNLAINARDAMPTGGVLTIETGAAALGVPTRPEEPSAGNYLTVTVRDTGSGMSAEVQAKAFEPFFTTKGPGSGSGLGLSQVLGFAHQSGGGVRIDSNPGAGTSVMVYLPPARSTAVPEAVPPSAPRILEATQSVILLVDDDDAVRTVTASILAVRGYRVIEASSGSAALDILAHQPRIDALLADVAMPEMNGPEVARQARRLRPDLPIVFFSGYADPEALAGEAFAEVLLRKPFNPDDLAGALENALRGR